MGMHQGQLVVNLTAVRRLVASQFPEWSGMRVEPVPSPGTVNALFRIGDGLVARFPFSPTTLRGSEAGSNQRWRRERVAWKDEIRDT